MLMFRCMFSIEASYGFNLLSWYILPEPIIIIWPTTSQVTINLLVKSSAVSKFPCSRIPAQLLDALLDPAMDWTSLSWTWHFRAIFTTVPPDRCIDCTTVHEEVFNSYCVKCSVLDPFPVKEKLVCYFATKLANDGLASQMIKVYLSATLSMQLSLGFLPPREESILPVLKRALDRIHRA